MQTLKIPTPKGFEVESFDAKTCELKLRETPKDILERINSIEDAIMELGENDEQVVIYKKLLSMFDASSHVVNYQLAIVLTRAINEKWEPNWEDGNQPKYTLNFIMGGSEGFRSYYYCDSWCTSSVVGSRLCFREIRGGKHMAEKFTNVFKQFMTIQK